MLAKIALSPLTLSRLAFWQGLQGVELVYQAIGEISCAMYNVISL